MCKQAEASRMGTNEEEEEGQEEIKISRQQARSR
jgi:hypothetical protein